MPRQPHEAAVDRLRIDALRARDGSLLAGPDATTGAVGHNRARNRLVDGEQASRPEEPQLVPDDRSALREVDIAVRADLVDRLHPVIGEKRGEVVALKRAALVSAEERSAEAIAAFLGNQVDLHAAGRRIDGAAARLVHHLLVARVIQITLDGAVALEAVDDHPVHQHRCLRRAQAVHGEIGLLHGLRAADIRRRQCHADHQLTHRLDGVRGRHGVEDLARQHLRFQIALDVDDGRFTGHRYGLLERAHAELDVDGRGEVGREVDPLTLHRREAGQREGDRVGARAQVDDPVRARRVGDHRACFLDQRRARGLDRDTGQHGAG